MGTTTPTVRSVNLVLVGVDLLVDPESLDEFRELVDPDLEIEFGLSTEMPTGVTTSTRKIRLNQNRVVLELSPVRSSITQEFPADRENLKRLTGAALAAIQCSGTAVGPSASGFNIELVYDQTSGHLADEYLGRRLFGNLQLGQPAWTLASGTGQIVFNDPDGLRRWTVNVRPRSISPPSTRVLLAMNLHYSERRIPSEQHIQFGMEELWDEAHALVNRLDGLEDRP